MADLYVVVAVLAFVVGTAFGFAVGWMGGAFFT